MTNVIANRELRLLAIESTCDETAAAVISGRSEVLSSVIASQNDLHAAFAGVVPEIAARAHLQAILPTIDEALRRADTKLSHLHAIAVATQPGLAGSLLVGLMAAKALSLALDIPLIEVNHIHAHIYACQIGRNASIFPCVGLVVSGGHTSLYRCESTKQFDLLGATIDDAAGEAFDKVAAMMGLGFPGGPALAKMADQGNSKSYSFPRSLPDRQGKLSFSFSGLKTAVRYALAKAGRADLAPPVRNKVGKPPLPASPNRDVPSPVMADIAASFQAAVIDILCERCHQALVKTGLKKLCVGGGVAANRAFREALSLRFESEIDLIVAPREYCTDNAAMGAIAIEHLLAEKFATLDIDCIAGLIRPKK